MSTRDRPWLEIVILCALVWSVYGNTLENPFEFDDWHVIPDNPAIKSLDRIPSFFVDVSAFSVLAGNRDYRPAFLVSMAICWWLGDGSSIPFHVVSVLLHTSSVLLLFLLFRELRRRAVDTLPAPSSAVEPARPPRRAADWGALFAAALFAVHPLATETVNYVSSQSAAMAASFYLLSFYLAARTARRSSSKGRRSATRLGSWLAYAVALLAKPIAITLPLVLFMWSWMIDARSGEQERPRVRARLMRALTTVAPFVLVSLLYIFVRQAVGVSSAGNLVAGRPDTAEVWSWYLTQTKAMVLYYLKLSIIPTGLNVDREYPLVTSAMDPSVVLSIAVMGVIAVALFRLRANRTLVFWSLWFPVCLFVTTYATVLGQVVNEHRAYLSLAGFCAVVGTLAEMVRARIPLRFWDTSVGPKTGRVALTATGVIILATFWGATRAQNRVWSSGLTLWENAARLDGTWRAHMNYGLALEAAGRPDESLRELERAVEIAPYAWAHMNLGLAYVKRDDTERGLEHLRTAVRLWPDLPEAHLYLGWALERAGNVEEAATEMRQAIELRPDYIKGHEYLGTLLSRQGRTDEAMLSYRRVLVLDPDREWVASEVRRLEAAMDGVGDSDARLGLRALSDNDFEAALERLERAHAGDPADTEILFGLAYAHQRLGRDGDAIRLYEELIGLDPSHRQGTFNLAYAYRDRPSAVELSRCVELFRRVLELDPDYDEALHHMATALWSLGDEDAARRSDSLYTEHGRDEGLRAQSIRRLETGE